jgi:hypothetical protein
MESRIPIVTAFRIRTALKSKLATWNEMFDSATKTWELHGSPDYTSSGGNSARTCLEWCEAYIKLLNAFEKQIEKANEASGAKEIMININTMNDGIAFYKYALVHAKRFKKYVDRVNPITGAMEKVEMDTDLDVAELQTAINRWQTNKFDLETELAETNSRTFVDLDVDYEEGEGESGEADRTMKLCDAIQSYMN